MDEKKIDIDESDGSVVQVRNYRPELNTATINKISSGASSAEVGSVHSSRRTQFLAYNYQGETAVLSAAWAVAEDATPGSDEPGEKVMYLADPKPRLEKEPPSATGSKTDTHSSGEKDRDTDWDDKRVQDKPEDKRDSKSSGGYYSDRK